MKDALVKLAQSLNLKDRTTPLVNAPTGTDSQSQIVRMLLFPGAKPEGTTTNNIYIGTGKVDTVVSDSITRLHKAGRNY
jgi:hypothetical protein